MRTICCIPARYGSSRLPGKPLLKICEKTIINHVYEKCKEIQGIDNIIVLTDDERILENVLSFNGKVCMITEECLNGTDRIIKYLKSIGEKYDVVLNVQGDEPFINTDNINRLLSDFSSNKKNRNIVCQSLYYKSSDSKEVLSRSRGKVVLNKYNDVLYCSRNVIPGTKKEYYIQEHEYNIHVGVFAYDYNYLLENYAIENTQCQLSEDIEWLKIIEQGFKMNLTLVTDAEIGVDTIDDYIFLKNKYELNSKYTNN